MYVGNLITALGCIDAGITCVIDNSHNSRSAAHSDAAVEALFDSGIRAVHASGPPQFGTWDKQWPADLARLQKKYFASDDQLVTLRAFANPNRDNWAFARKPGAEDPLGRHLLGSDRGIREGEPSRTGLHLQPRQRADRCGLAPGPRDGL